MVFFYGLKEISKDEIYNLQDDDVEVGDDFVFIDDFVEPGQANAPKIKEIEPEFAAFDEEEEWKGIAPTEEAEEEKVQAETTNEQDSFEEGHADSIWHQYGLNDILIDNLLKLKFVTPTKIQEETLKHAANYKDIVGAAETGSGKTLAFGLPIVNYLLENPPAGHVHALILVPTRELAIQVMEHLRNVSPKEDQKKIIAIVGGMSTEKQERLMKKVPNILVCTPGRLWALLNENEEFKSLLYNIRYFVMDEADRMLEQNHFKHLDEIIEMISVQKLPKDKCKRQTFVFSATMINESIHHNVQRKKRTNSNELFEQLLKKIEFRDKKPIYINLAPKQFTAKGVYEAKIDCVKTEKDLMLYYVLSRYIGKTIVFVNSIDAIRRLVPIMSFLQSNVYGLHAEMQQKQRIKSLEQFTQAKNAVLIASDVAARGLDIPAVDHVIHYQIPRAADTYIHRSGRTARGSNNEGVSIMLCAPEEQSMYSKLCFALKKEEGVVEFPTDMGILAALKKRLALAKQLDQLVHQSKKEKNDTDWFKKAAEDAEIYLSDNSDDEDRSHKQKQHSMKVAKMKAELKALLEQPLIPKGHSTKYLTRNPDLAEIIRKSTNSAMPTVQQTKATSDLKEKIDNHVPLKKRSFSKPKPSPKKQKRNQ